MEMRVEQLAVQSEVSVDTIRYYQHKGLLDPPRREGRVAWYDTTHLERLSRIRSLQERGFTLATIVRLVSGDLDTADEALLGELFGLPTTPETSNTDTERTSSPEGHVEGERVFTIAELSSETGVPLALLKAIEAEGLLIPRRVGGVERYTEEDVAASKAGLLLLDWGVPLSALLELARRHHEATEAVAREAVSMFTTHVRGSLRASHHSPTTPDVDRLLQAYAELLPAVTALVGHHFARALVQAALDQVEQTGSDEERRAVWSQVGVGLSDQLVQADTPTTGARR